MLLVAMLSNFALCAAQPAARPDSGEAVLQFLNQTIDWYRRVTTLDQTPVATQDVLFRDAVHRDAQQVLSLSFTYARAQAALLAEQGAAPSSAIRKPTGSAIRSRSNWSMLPRLRVRCVSGLCVMRQALCRGLDKSRPSSGSPPRWRVMAAAAELELKE